SRSSSAISAGLITTPSSSPLGKTASNVPSSAIPGNQRVIQVSRSMALGVQSDQSSVIQRAAKSGWGQMGKHSSPSEETTAQPDGLYRLQTCPFLATWVIKY